MTSPHHHDPYYDNMGSQRQPGLTSQSSHQNLHRQTSRHHLVPDNAYNYNNGLYTAEDHAAARYETDRFGQRLGNGMSNVVSGYPYESSGAQTWNPNSYGAASTIGQMGTTGRIKSQGRQRAQLPSDWMGQPQQMPSNNPLAQLSTLSLGQMRPDTVNSDPNMDEELIPTAIVIKNIPFAVKKEQLVQLMTELGLPLPYAFNYHFDNGVFRGLAFANFTTPEETATVIDVLNHFELQGRKLRVEYKKMLPLVERERIEREKRERRGQLEEQHRPVPITSLQNPIMPSATSPAPMSTGSTRSKPAADVDLNDPQTLQFYSQLLLFRDDMNREALIFPSTLSPQQRRIVHTLAHHMGLAHISRGTGETRQVHVFRAPSATPSLNPSGIPTTVQPIEHHNRRGLSRAITMDFSETRNAHDGVYSNIGRTTASLLDVPISPNGARDFSRQNLRPAKSFADLRSYTPSPVPSTASFPASLGAGLVARYGDYAGTSVSSATPNLTPTGTGNNILSLGNSSESMLVNGLSGMSLGGSALGAVGSGSLREARGQFLERQQQQLQQQQREDQQRDNLQQAFGSQRNAYGSNNYQQQQQNYDESPTRETRGGQTIAPYRQPKGPDSAGSGFSRGLNHNGHGSVRNSNGQELDVQSGVPIVVE
ncbi:hypothetical protein BJ508DRAFT_310140 [Ascobolus immersus RN42]|uniref:R3H domain protein n=1 Tax=Ascobolus immersus RN42 TaxID=1160509 RepID=A0A3N4HUU9_ASCIM|nr:hypothetical protein BJ508DRAFT_310140 [Ascobolus immersus RN42]